MARLRVHKSAAACLLGYIPLPMSARMALKRKADDLSHSSSDIQPPDVVKKPKLRSTMSPKMALPKSPLNLSPPELVNDLDISDNGESTSSSRKETSTRKKAPPDADAVERRRTQLRLAQRAYRERKELTISDLEKKTANLERALGDMYSIFSEYHESAALQQTSSTDAKWVTDLGQVREQLNYAMQQAGVDPAGETVNERRRIRASASPLPTASIFEPDDVRRHRALSTGFVMPASDTTTTGYTFGDNTCAAGTMFVSEIPATLAQQSALYATEMPYRTSEPQQYSAGTGTGECLCVQAWLQTFDRLPPNWAHAPDCQYFQNNQYNAYPQAGSQR